MPTLRDLADIYQAQDEGRRQQTLSMLAGNLPFMGGTLSVDPGSLYGFGRLAAGGRKGLQADEMELMRRSYEKGYGGYEPPQYMMRWSKQF